MDSNSQNASNGIIPLLLSMNPFLLNQSGSNGKTLTLMDRLFEMAATIAVTKLVPNLSDWLITYVKCKVPFALHHVRVWILRALGFLVMRLAKAMRLSFNGYATSATGNGIQALLVKKALRAKREEKYVLPRILDVRGKNLPTKGTYEFEGFPGDPLVDAILWFLTRSEPVSCLDPVTGEFWKISCEQKTDISPSRLTSKQMNNKDKGGPISHEQLLTSQFWTA